MNRAGALIDTVVWGLTAPAEEIEEKNRRIASEEVNPASVPRSAQPI